MNSSILSINGINLIIGAILLTLGRRFFWLFVGCIGFALGVHYAPQLWEVTSHGLLFVLAVITGIVGAVLALVFQKFAIGLAGFAAGGYIAINLINIVGLRLGPFIWLPHIIGGIIGTLLLFLIFDWALILVSSFAGASLIIQTVNLNPRIEVWLFFALFVGGILIQTTFFLKRPSV
jgi:hypothetical protein